MSSPNTVLLPSGFYDLVYPQSKLRFDIIANISQYFENMGYQRTIPPVIEFEDSLFDVSGKSLENNTFRVMDSISHRMMGVRADMTVQIARIARTSLKSEPRPLRLMYSGDVFRVKGKGIDSERQLTQVGLELIGKDNALADAESISISIGALEEVGIKDICLDLNLPKLATILLEDIKEDNEKQEILGLINRKDTQEIEQFSFKNKQEILTILSQDITSKLIKSLDLPTEVIDLFKRIFDVKELIESKHPNLNVTIDPLICDPFDYHSGIGFCIFTKTAPLEIGRGGRYLIDDEETAIGSTIYINELIKILKPKKEKPNISVDFNESQKRINELQAQGYIVSYQLNDK